MSVFGALLCGALLGVAGWGVAMPEAVAPRLEGDELTATYTDFLSLTLTSLAVILAVLAIFIGALAIIGYTQIQRMVERKAEEEANKVISAALNNGGTLSETVQKALERDGPLYNMVLEQLGRKGDLFNALKEEVYSGIVQWESSGYDDPEEEEGEGEEG